MPKWKMVRKRGFLHAGTRRDVAPLLVTVPHWTRLNLYAIPPDSRPHHPVAEAIIVAAYMRRLPKTLAYGR